MLTAGIILSIIGFAILFIGLSYLKASVPNIGDSPEILSFLQNTLNSLHRNSRYCLKSVCKLVL